MLDLADELRLDILRSFPAGRMVLSVYLPIDPEQVTQRGYVAELMNTLREARDGCPAGIREGFDEEAERVLRFVREDFEPSGRTLVMFSSTPSDTLEVLRLRVPLSALVRFGPRPYLAPLEAALDNDPRVGIAVVDERQARLMISFLSELEFQRKVKDPVPGRQRQGGWSAFRYERDRAHHVQEHLRHVARLLAGLHKERPLKALVIGGTAETVSALGRELEPELQTILAGSFPAEMFASDHEVLLTALPIAARREREEELQLVAGIREAALDGRRAALGWDETLQMLAEGRVLRLAVGERNIGTSRGDKALMLAWDSDAKVEFLRGDAESMLDDNGGIGALLRY